MDWDDLREKRFKAIEDMNKTVGEMRPTGLPRWFCMMGMFPVGLAMVTWHLITSVRILVGIWLTLLFKIVIAPLQVTWFFMDLSMITFWFFRLVAEKMSGKDKL